MAEHEVSEGSRRSRAGPSLRIVPVSVGFLLPAQRPASTDRLCEEIPAYSSVLLRLAKC